MRIPVKSPAELERMRVSGRIAARVLAAVAREVRPGITTAELDEFARVCIAAEGAVSAFKGYRGYPGQICVSVNEEVVHGVPGVRRIQMGDLVSLDVGVKFDGFFGDNAKTVLVGVTDPEIVRLVQVAEESLKAAIRQAVDGRQLSDVSHAVQSVVEGAGFSVVRDFVGHGIGRAMHEPPQIPNFGKPGQGPRLKAGMTLAIEPMVNLGGYEVRVLGDRWTVVTVDGRPSAHVEHTVVVGMERAEILTTDE